MSKPSVRVWARGHYVSGTRVRRSPGLHGPRGAASHARPRPLKETSAERLLAAARLPQPLPRDKGARLMLLACVPQPTKGPRLRAHRLVRASGRAAAGAAQPAGTMAPFARNDKTILEIALPALVGFNAGVLRQQLA